MVPPVKIAKENFIEKLIKQWGFKLGRIYDLQTSPCQNNNFFIFIAAFVASIPEAIASLNQFECNDQGWDKASQAYKYKPPRGGARHGRRGTPTLREGEKQPKSFSTKDALAYSAFVGGNLIQKIGAKLLIIDTALDLGINWSSLALQWNGCDVPPEVNGVAEAGQRVYGCGGAAVGTGCVALGPSVGIAFGIGGFITTVPVGTLNTRGNISCKQFGVRPYFPLNGVRWFVFRNGDGSALHVDQVDTLGVETDPTQGNHNASAMGTVTIPNVVGMNGDLVIIPPTCDDGGGTWDKSLIQIDAERKGFLFATENPDPCKNLPLAGGIGPRR